jgi:putative glutamine amidotransferase
MAPRIGLTTSPEVLEGRAVQALEQAYVSAVAGAGGVPLLLPVLEHAQAEAVVGGLDGLLITGGGDVDPSWYGCPPSEHLGTVDAARDAWELALARAAVGNRLPVLGICRGAQLLNVAMGGTLVLHLPDVTDQQHCVEDRCSVPVHSVAVEVASRLRTIVGCDVLGVNSLHHQAADRVGTGLLAVALAEDGTIEAVESNGAHRLLGVQWHPELLTDDPSHAALFRWLVDEAAAGDLAATAA